MMTFLNIISDEILRSRLEELYHLYKRDLLYIANDILNDYHESEDVIQTAFIKFSDYIDNEMDVKCCKTKALIAIIVRNLSLNIYNQRKRKATMNIDDFRDVICDNENLDPEVSILRLDNSREMAKWLSEINTRYADILVMKYNYEFTNNEIATMLSISEANVRKRLSRAKKSFKKIVEGSGDYE